MKVLVNGDERDFPDGATVADLLRELGVARGGVAVAVNGEVVARTNHVRTVVPAGAEVEVLTAVQGG